MRNWSYRLVVALTLCMALGGGVASAQSGAGQPPATITLERLLVAPAGTQAVYYIEEFVSQYVVDAAGLFELADTSEMEEMSYVAVIAHYTMLPPAPGDNRPRIEVRAVAVEPETGLILEGLRWTVTYALSVDGVVRVGGDVVADEYEDVLEPTWLADWTIVSWPDVPAGPIAVGDEWTGMPSFDAVELGATSEWRDALAIGSFVGWTDGVGGPGAAAQISEYATGVVVWQDDLGGFGGHFELAVEGLKDTWLVPGTFPAGMNGVLFGDSRLTVGPETGAPQGLSGYLDASMYYELYVEQVDAGVFPWWAFADASSGSAGAVDEAPAATSGDGLAGTDIPVLAPGRTVSGRLTELSDLLDDGTYADYYLLYGDAGQRIVLELRSAEFDAFLFVFSEDGQLVALDDDSAGQSNARIEMTLPSTGAYLVVANAYGPGQTGAYTLSLEQAEEPPVDFDRAVNLIGLLSVDYPLTDSELAEAEQLLEQLLELIRSRR